MRRQLTLDVLIDRDDRRQALRSDVVSGLAGPVKRLPPVWFYDEVGSRLYDEITRLPEYYPFRLERSILEAAAAEIAVASGADTLVEIGSGTSEKTLFLLDALAAAGTLRRVILFDISEDILAEAAASIGRTYGVDVDAIAGDFRYHIGHIPRGGRQLWAFLGGTIGNLSPNERHQLLCRIRSAILDGGHLLLGADLEKDIARTVAAYDDAAGVTAEFNRNVLHVINRELGADFDPDLFEHLAVWNHEERWIEMRLKARVAHSVTVSDPGIALSFETSEEILTETSAKFTGRRLDRELSEAGLFTRRAWSDDAQDFLVTLSCAAGNSQSESQQEGYHGIGETVCLA